MASKVTLADGTKATVDPGNYADLARLQISLQSAKFGAAYDVNQQAATLQAFKQLAGLPPVYNINSEGAATLDDGAQTYAALVDSNPLVEVSNAITNPGATLAHIGDTIKAGLQHAAGFVEEANTTAKIGLVVAGIAGVAVILFYAHRLAKIV